MAAHSPIVPTQATPCRVWIDHAHAPAFNMAADETLLQAAEAGGPPWIRFYGWDRDAVSIGYFQPHTVAPRGCAVVRRLTGGGLVYHTHDLTFSLAVPRAHQLWQADRFAGYRLVNEAVLHGLRSLGIEASLAPVEAPVEDRRLLVCFQSPARHDVIAAGGKVCGGAQRRTRKGLLLQASIELSRLPGLCRDALREALTPHLAALLGDGQAMPCEPDADMYRAIDALAEAR